MATKINSCLAHLKSQNIELKDLVLLVLKHPSHTGLVADERRKLILAAPELIESLNKYTNTPEFSTSLLECTIAVCKRDPSRGAALFTSLASSCTTPELIASIHSVVRESCRKELIGLCEKRAGLHFNATNATPEQVDAFSLTELRKIMKKWAPYTCKLLSVLLNARKSHRRVGGFQNEGEWDGDDDGDTVMTAFSATPDLDSDTEYVGASDSDASDEEEEPKAGKRRQLAITRRDKLIKIKVVMLVSVCAQSTNEKANTFQSLVGIFLRSVDTSERSMQILSRMGVSVSGQTADNSLASLAKTQRARTMDLGRTLTFAAGYDNINVQFGRSTSDTSMPEFKNLTTATALPMIDTRPEDLRFTEEIWKRSPLNPDAKDPIRHVASFDSLRLLDNESDGLAVLDRSYKASVWHVKRCLLNHARSSAYPNVKELLQRLGTSPGVRNQIPVIKTEQNPLRTMDEDEATLQGNANVCKGVLEQMGLARDGAMREYILPLHGDLATLERIDGLLDVRKWCKAGLVDKMQHLVCIPGLFHAIMAAAAALHRIYWSGSNQLARGATIWGYTPEFTRPADMKKMATNPGFRRTHNAINLLFEALVIHLWSISIPSADLEAWFKTKPSWDDMDVLARGIVNNYVAGFADRPTDDTVHRNHQLMLRDFLLYVEFTHAIKHGDIGRVEDAIPIWVLIWRATGKHKYATYYHEFLLKLRTWPAPLARVIRLNWLCNPTGKPDGFRGVDWLIELNNLYIKVVFCGHGPNRSVELIQKHSILIEILRRCHVIFDDNFYNLARTKRRSAPKMDVILARLRQMMEKHQIAKVDVSRKSKPVYMDALFVGTDKYQADVRGPGLVEEAGEALEIDKGQEIIEIEVDDLIAF